jgi:hypothetical protein
MYTMEYYSAFKRPMNPDTSNKNEHVPLTTWNLENIAN